MSEMPNKAILCWSPGSLSTLQVMHEIYNKDLTHAEYVRRDLHQAALALCHAKLERANEVIDLAKLALEKISGGMDQDGKDYYDGWTHQYKELADIQLKAIAAYKAEDGGK